MQAYTSNTVWMYVAFNYIDVVYYLRNFERYYKHMWIFVVYCFTPAHFLSFSRFLDNFWRRRQWCKIAFKQKFSNGLYN